MITYAFYFDALVVVTGDAATLDAIAAHPPAWCDEWRPGGVGRLLLWVEPDGVTDDAVAAWARDVNEAIARPKPASEQLSLIG